MQKLYDMTASKYVLSYLMHMPDTMTLDADIRLDVYDFPKNLHRIVFGCVLNLSNEGVSKITPQDVDLYLVNYPEKYLLYKDNKGLEFLNNIYKLCETSDKNQFMYYYNRIKKFSLLRSLEENGINIAPIYDVNIDIMKADQQADKFDAMSCDDIIKFYKNQLSLIESKSAGSYTSNSQYAADGIEELLLELATTPEIGSELDGQMINYATRGARKGKCYIYSANSGGGKALPNSTQIPLFNGKWKTVESIEAGDELIDRQGNPTKVIQTFPQGKKEVWEIKFKDGRTAKCCDEHLWSFTLNGSDILETATLKEIVELRKKNDVFVPMNQAIKYLGTEMSIDSYVLGLFLGCNKFGLDKTMYLDLNNMDMVRQICNAMNWSYTVETASNHLFLFWDRDGNEVAIKCGDFIPEEYFAAACEDRISLLQGLMDGGGLIDEKGLYSFCSSNPRLTQDFQKLCWGLGLKSAAHEGFHISPKEGISFFRLQKNSAVKCTECNNKNLILSIEKLGRSEEMTCFLVDNEEHLFLMNDYIVTHNTRTMMGNACKLCYPRIEGNKILVPEYTGKVLFIPTEMQADELQTLILSYISGVNEERILLGTLTPRDKILLQCAVKIMKQYQHNFIIENLQEPDIKTLKSIIVNHILKNEVEYVFYDYIGSSVGLMSEFKGMGLREDVLLMLMSNTLKEIASTYGVFVMSATQLSGEWDKKTFRNQNFIRGSKSIVDKVDTGMIGVRIPDDEMKAVSGFVNELIEVKPNIVIDIYKNRRGKMCDVKVFRHFDYGTCRSKDLFITTANWSLVKDYTILDYETNELLITEYMK